MTGDFETILKDLEHKVRQIQAHVRTSYSQGVRLNLEHVSILSDISHEVNNLRDLCVLKDYLQGILQKDIAIKYNLSAGRISQIIKKLKHDMSSKTM